MEKILTLFMYMMFSLIFALQNNDATPFHPQLTKLHQSAPEFPRLSLIDNDDSYTITPALEFSRAVRTPSTHAMLPSAEELQRQSKSRAQRMKKTRDGVKIASLGSTVSSTSHSQRLLNDLLVVPPPHNSRLYVLVLMSIHEHSFNEKLECGHVNLDGFIKLAAFLNALHEANSSPLLDSLSLGAVIIDTCSSDLRTIADLYEILSGTQIQKSDLVAVIRDDDSHLPNVDVFISRLGLPVIYSFPAKNIAQSLLMSANSQSIRIDAQHAGSSLPAQTLSPVSTATPLSGPLITSLLHILRHSNSSCFSMLFDNAHKSLILGIRQLADDLDLCVEESIQIDEDDSTAEIAIRRLLLTEARAVIVLLDKPEWLQLLRALREELVIPGRFILIAPQHSSWLSSRSFRVNWPYFDQLLIASNREVDNNEAILRQDRLDLLAKRISELPIPQSWTRHFWATAYECHVAGDASSSGDSQFSRMCPSRNLVNLTEVSPSVDILPIERSVEALASGLRHLVDSLCPNVRITSIADCTNRPAPSLSAALHSLDFVHSINFEHSPLSNITFFDTRVRVNRANIVNGELRFTRMALFDDKKELIAQNLFLIERDGSEIPIASSCPRCTCSSLRLSRRRSRPPPPPSLFSSALRSPSLLVFSLASVMAALVCMIGIYQKLISMEPFRICGIFTHIGLTILCTLSPFFVLPSSPFSCILKKHGLWLCFSMIYGPVFVETVLVSLRRHHPSNSLLICLCLIVFTLQRILLRETRTLHYDNEVVFVTIEGHEESGIWRCAPGDNFESSLLLSCLFSAVLVPLSLLLAFIWGRSLRKSMGAMSVHLLVFALPLPIILPNINFESRDTVFASGILLFSVSLLSMSLFRSRLNHSTDKAAFGIKREYGSSRHSEWDDDDERRFNEAVAAVVKGCDAGDKYNSSSKIMDGHVFYINEATGALTSQPLRGPDYTLKKAAIEDDNMEERRTAQFYGCGTRERVHTNGRSPPQGQLRNAHRYNDSTPPRSAPRTPNVHERQHSFNFENERF